MCSTPFGIRGILTLAKQFLRVGGGACSTPFGIRGILTNRNPEPGKIPLGWCSTPFGIRGILTAPGLRPSCAEACAQRLSASEVSSPNRSHRAGSLTSLVLNAFRHQRYPHRQERFERSVCGIVLNAFRHQRYPHTHSRLIAHDRVLSAQRLSASEVSSRLAIHPDLVQVHVLNAFRHQRYPHSSMYAPPALIAPGAQRLSASEVSSQVILRWDRRVRQALCSTPFGIRGILTSERRKP